MRVHTRLSLRAGLLVTLLAALAIAALTVPALAAPGAQDDENLPTPTLIPVGEVPYTLDVVGGEDATYTFAYDDADGFTLGEATVRSDYPLGMTFTLNPSSTNGEIADVILFIRFVHGSGTRVEAAWSDEAGAWVARPWDTGGRPPWSAFDFYWRVRDESGASVDTAANPMNYFDPANAWFRVESDHVVLYWYGFGDDVADEIARNMVDLSAALHERRVLGFGRALSYKPITVIFPDRDALSAMYGSGVSNNRAAGFTSSDLGMSVQVLRSTDNPPNQENCIYAPEDPAAYWTMERRIGTIYNVTGHEITHLYQYDIMGGMMGYEWWFEGQAEWFSSTTRNYDTRLRHLATLQDIPSLTTPVGSDLNQADGCYALSYNVGPSFINFIMNNYGGIETHARIVELMRDEGNSVFESLEIITGKPFIDLENEWRAYLGFAPLSLADIDPAAALEDPVNPIAQPGDTVTLPPTPALSPVNEVPGPRSLASGQCFANMQVKILRVGSLDGVDYYEVDCMGQIGWMSAEQLGG